MPHTVAVVGAGIAGLTAAWRLQQQGVRVRVFEREPQPGGRMCTITRDGFRIELGASVLAETYTGMKDLIAELGISDAYGPANAIFGFLRQGRVHRLRGESKTDLLRTHLIGLRSKLAVARVVPNLVRHRKRLDWDTMAQSTDLDQLSVTAYSSRHLTQEIHDYLCEPMFGGGIVLGDPSQMTAADMLFYAAKLLVPHFNTPHGVGLLTRTLADRLPVTLSAVATEVRTTPKGITVTWHHHGHPQPDEHADAAIIALPAPQVPAILPDLTADDAAYLRSVPYSRGLGVCFGLSHPPHEASANLFVPCVSHPEIAAIELHHNKIHARVDDGRALITVYPRKVFTDQWWNDTNDTIAARILKITDTILPGVRHNVVTTYINRRDPALVVRPPGGYADLRAFNARRRDADPRIQLAGDYFGPSSTYGSLRSGEHAATRLLGHLATTTPQP
jgi:oxygen-dependent protoporphyrinogen oxidase